MSVLGLIWSYNYGTSTDSKASKKYDEAKKIAETLPILEQSDVTVHTEWITKMNQDITHKTNYESYCRDVVFTAMKGNLLKNVSINPYSKTSLIGRYGKNFGWKEYVMVAQMLGLTKQISKKYEKNTALFKNYMMMYKDDRQAIIEVEQWVERPVVSTYCVDKTSLFIRKGYTPEELKLMSNNELKDCREYNSAERIEEKAYTVYRDKIEITSTKTFSEAMSMVLRNRYVASSGSSNQQQNKEEK